MRRGGGAPAWLPPVLGALLLWPACAPEPPASPFPERGVEATLGPGEVHLYRLPLAAGDLVRLTVEQQGVDAVVSLAAPDGEVLLRADRLTGARGPELILAVAERSGPHRLEIRAFAGSGPGRYAARIGALRPALGEDRRRAGAYRRFLAAKELRGGGERLAALSRVVATLRQLDAPDLLGEALVVRARHRADRGDAAGAAEDGAAAAALFARTGNRLWEMLARANRGDHLLSLAATGRALDEYAAALELAHREGHGFTIARIHEGLGKAHRWRGELQPALDHYARALDAWPPDDTLSRPSTLHSLGVLHGRFLGHAERGRELLLQARDAWAMPLRARHKAATLGQLGYLALDEGRPEEALEHLHRALKLRPEPDCGRAVLLARAALAHARLGAPAVARQRLQEALADLAQRPCRRTAPTVHRYAADVHEALGDVLPALLTYRRCADLYAVQGDRNGRGDCLAGVARAERARGDPMAALEASRQVLALVEGVRPTVLRGDYRTSYFAGVQGHYDLHVDLLLELGRSEEAWFTAERARARTLRDLLAEAGTPAAAPAPPELVARAARLQRHLNALENRRLAVSEADDERLDALALRIGAVIDELEEVRGEIRRHTDAGAEPVSPADLRDQLDGDALLLEFRLGDAAGTLWAVDRRSLTAHRLPPRNEVESVAREVIRWLGGTRWPGRNPAALCELSRLLLGPVAGELRERPLVLVPDGALEAVSFAALPDPAAPGPCADAPPLVARHDLSYLPSAATLAVQRRRLAGRRPADGWLAVVADPVYGPEDERLPAAHRGAGAPEVPLQRLPWTGEEARAILGLLPADRTVALLGTGASRRAVLAGRLAGYRIVHVATHGVLHAERPLWLSHLALSRRDDAGRPVDGVLPAHEIRHLELPAELVVLSACDTALGRQVRGEGLTAGLPRAFLSAGASRVVVSLWAVDDRSTRDLMVRFYTALLRDGLPPARALARAQRALWRQGQPPHGWAGFVLQGDPRPLPPFAF